MDFSAVQMRLIAAAKARVRDGSLTERGLARSIGVSQPHIHNVLKGARILTPFIADKILFALNMSIGCLLREDEIAWAGSRQPADGQRYLEVPMLEGLLGPAFPYPQIEGRLARYPFMASFLAGLERPVVARLGKDSALTGFPRENDLVLLDRSPRKLIHPAPDVWYAVSIDGRGLIRKACPGALDSFAGKECISLVNRNILDILKATVVWLGREMEQASVEPRPIDETRQKN